MIYTYEEKKPVIATTAFIAEYVSIIGDVSIEDNASIWYGATIRGDMSSVSIGKNTNIQENTVVHVSTDIPTIIEDNVTVGHLCILHSCTVKQGALIGMGSTILDGAIIGEGSLIGAGSLVPPGKTIPPNSLAFGNPIKVYRELNDQDKEGMKQNVLEYVNKAAIYKKMQKEQNTKE